ncbi:MBL fold metallo-hydrolase [Nocardioides marmoriginsengisoli]|uniref:MBL fold metallo-hydrolase n=1 Tax=Nocardioides marmoriginsengisoli TaxID=661483 RepID=A0A3N0CJU0_9ACTN|nr:MBL fold metallo-hydrolase [Nocardioides marmoriginsengisoli]RNL63720.1 MBL fold metallo-hydrolase [Nocardioides marmoriginsengisoli]
MTDFTEIADRIWVARYPWFDVNVGLIGGSEGLVVVDTNASAALGAEVVAAVRRISAAPILAAVNTHVHFDHTFGNAALAAAGAELVAHEDAAAALPAHAAEIRAEAAGNADEQDLLVGEIAVPTRTFSSALALDLGDRAVELIHPGRGHTAGDLIVKVPDADVVFAGDLVEESVARAGVPGYGADCYPMDWPSSLDLVLSLTGTGTRIVPGHGAVVDQDFVHEQRSAIGVVAETIRDLAGRGVPVEQAIEVGDWPYPREEMADAVRRGYEQLPAVRRQLPLI